MNEKIFVGVIMVIVVLGLGSFFFGGAVTGDAVDTASVGEAQVVEIGLSREGYTPSTITVKANQPVILKNDGTLGGCGLYPTQAELGINADFSKDDTYEFTPTKKGKFTYTCSMGMFKGTIEVV